MRHGNQGAMCDGGDCDWWEPISGRGERERESAQRAEIEQQRVGPEHGTRRRKRKAKARETALAKTAKQAKQRSKPQ
jgi:hypothetical protein